MTNEEIDELIAHLKEMASHVGAVFVPDPEKIKAYRRARDSRRGIRASDLVG
jgi:hypothetical protein